MRIGLITPEYPTVSPAGGIGSYVRTLAASFMRLGHSPLVILADGKPGEVSPDGEIPVYRAACGRLSSSLPLTLARVIALTWCFPALVRRFQLDVVEAPEYGGLTAFVRSLPAPRPPVVVRLHTCSALVRQANASATLHFRKKLSAPVANWLERRTIETADAVTSCSTAVAQATRQILAVKREDFQVVPNPAAELFLRGGESVPETAQPLVLFVGRLEWRKGADLLIRAVPQILGRHPAARFCFIGDDTPWAPAGTSVLACLRRLLGDDYSRYVEFRGMVAQELLPELYRSASVCVFPSRWEAFGLVVAEAMACGRPVVVSDVPGFRELVTDGRTGLVVPAEKPQAIGDAVCRLLSDPALRARLGAAARGHARSRFAPITVAQSTISVYQNVIENSRVRPPH